MFMDLIKMKMIRMMNKKKDDDNKSRDKKKI